MRILSYLLLSLFFLHTVGHHQVDAAERLQPVTLQLKWFHQFQFAGYYAALHKGYYKEQGLDVTLVAGGPDIHVDDEVLSGRADFGVLASELIEKKTSGKPLVLLAVIMQHSTRAIIVRSDSGINAPTDLIGKRLMINLNEDIEFQAMFKAEGIDYKKLTIIPKDNTANSKFITGKIDGLNGSIGNQPFLFSMKNIEVKTIRPISYGIDFYGDSLFTSDKQLKDHPETVAQFRRATLQGWEYAMNNVEEMIYLIINEYGSSKSREQLLFEADAMQKLILPDLIDIGNISPHRIERIAQIYADLGLVPENYSLQGFIYNPTKDNGTIRTIISALSIALTVAAFIGVILVLFNSRLKKQVAEQTKELRTSTSLLKTVIEGTTDAIFLKNLQGQYLLANNSTLKAIGKSEAEVIGKTNNELFSEDSSIPMNKFDQSVLQSGVSKTAEERLTTSYGDSYWLTTKTPYRDQEGNIIGLIGVSRNITELKRVEEEKKALQKHLAQAQKMESIGTLAGGIAHDFNNILSSVLGYTELALQDAEKNSEQQSHLNQVLTAGNRAKDLVRQILAVARKSDEEIKPLKLGKLVSEVIKFIRSTTPTTIEIVQSIENNSPIMASPTQMHQVLMNLCTNATHAMQENGGVLEVTLNDVAYTNELRTLGLDPNIDIYIKLTVSDTGTGIDPAIMENIFEPYFTTKGIGGGTGLGLAMVKGIIEGYGGQIRVTSIPDQKTTFTVYLPTTTQKISKDYHHKSPPQRGDEHILIVDDEPAVAKMESEILGSLGYTVTTKTDSRESLEFFKKESNGIDLVITDMTMPQITGDILATELRKIRPEIPIILCTGYSSRINKESAKDLGINAFIDKPFSQSDIADVIRNVLDGSDQSR